MSADQTPWQPEIDELNHRRTLMQDMGGEERVKRQHDGGKLTARERLAAFADAGSFREFRHLVGEPTYDAEGNLEAFLPKGLIEGMAKVGRHKVVVTAGDFTVRGGSGAGSARGALGL